MLKCFCIDFKVLFVLVLTVTNGYSKTSARTLADSYRRSDLQTNEISRRKLPRDSVAHARDYRYFYRLSLDKLKKSLYIEALSYIDSAIVLASKMADRRILADLYRHKAGILYEKDDINRSADWLFKSLRIYDSLKDYGGMVATYNNLGLLYKNIPDTAKAIHYFRKGIDLAEKRRMFKDLAYLYGNYGHLFKASHPDSALFYYRNSARLYEKSMDTVGMATNYYDMANVYAFYRKNPDSASYYYARARRLASHNIALLTKIMSAQAKFHYNNRQIQKSIDLNRRVYDLARQYRLLKPRELSTYYLYNAYRKLKKWDSAMYFLEDFVDTHDTIRDKKSQIKLQNLEAKYLNEKYKSSLEILKQKYKRRKILQIFLAIFLFLTLLSLYLVYQTFRQKRRALQAEKEKVDQELTFQTKQLMSQTALIARKNKILSQILQEIAEIKTQEPGTKEKIKKIKLKLKRMLQSDRDWDTFKIFFEEIHKDFFKKLIDICPNLTQTDLKLAALIKLGFNIKETATLLYLSPDSVKTARSRLRKKLKLPKDEKLFNFLNKI